MSMFSSSPQTSGSAPQTYPYHKNIRSPASLHMGTSGSLPQLGRNMGGLVDYVEVLVTGKGASSTGKPLGNKYFMKTGTTCKDDKTKKDVPRYIYINNVPQGGIPLISNVMGINMSSFRGLIPGAVSNMEVLNPMAIMSAFTSGSKPICRALTMETIDINNTTGTDTQFVADVDIKDLNPCMWGGSGTNPVSGVKCSEGFSGLSTFSGSPIETAPTLPNDVMAQIYFVCLGLLVIYIMFCLMTNIQK